MARCIIIAPLYRGEEAVLVSPEHGDLLLCADGGYAAATACGLTPELVIGDFDTMPAARVQGVPVMQLPVMKDDTDLAACIHEGRKRGYRSFVLAGCLGGRLDHTLATLQCMADGALRGETYWAVDGTNRAAMLAPGHHVLPRMEGRLFSLLAFTEQVTSIELTGTQWPLHDAVLTQRTPLGVSNIITEDAASLRFSSGLLLAVYAHNETCL